MLTSEIGEDELLLILNSFSKNKSPGIDGIPIEFYLKFFNLIKSELCEVLNYILDGNKMSESQRTALIVLLFKGGDSQLISSWRPISLICVDTKILSKVLVNRIKPILSKCISEEQYCGGEKSILDCNNTTRDMLHYINERNITGALINIDLQKAFDSIDHNFLLKIMKKMGFSDTFLGWVKILYTEILSICLINGHQGDAFRIERGVRQDCPLSMIPYIISQEPLYLALKHSSHIKTIDTPCKPKKLLGYADDTTIFVVSDLGMIFVFTILKYFHLASSIKLNMKKTKIFGFGDWKDRHDWPYKEVAVENSNINILGITFSNNIDEAIEVQWSNVLLKLKHHINILKCRSFTLFQRAIVINTIILSKVWYTAHTYPLPTKYSKLINKEIFQFLWESKYNPIKREVLYQNKYEGGLGISCVFLKAQSIFASTFLKQFLNSEENNSLIKY